ncbi:MAG: hypothetical protein RIC19_19135 [Phaeodactylibacter sp.]|uniref:DUF6603 domain-containing protein n=1 Tax=Phaeodactylibacter sp. TaxID=1940289 RepID=UPI0032F05A0E
MPAATNNQPSTLLQLAQELGKVYDPGQYQGVLQRMYPDGPVNAIRDQLPVFPANFTDLELPAQLQALRQWVEDAQSLDLSSLIDDAPAFARRFNDYLLADYLRANWPGFYQLASLLGWIRFELDEEHRFFEEEPVYGAAPIDWDSLPRFFTDPAAVFAEAGHGWGTAAFAEQYPFLFYHLGEWLNTQRSRGFPPADAELRENGEKLYVPLWAAGTGGVATNFGFELSRLGQDGILATPQGEATAEQAVKLTQTASLLLELILQATVALEGGFQMEVAPNGATLKQTDVAIAGKVLAGLRASRPSDRLTLLGTAEGNRLDLQAFSVKAGLQVATGNALEFLTEIHLQEGRILIVSAGSDGFLNNLMPKDGIAALFDLTIGWSSLQGIYFRGSAGLEVKIPAHIELGALEIQGISLGLKPKLEAGSPPAFEIPLSTDVQLLLGPFTAVVQEMGIKALINYQATGGNLGVLDFGMDFKPPKGIGLSLETPTIKGGGYLFLDFEKGEYAGVAELVIKQMVAVKAIGILQTKKPDGSPGFSFLLLITAEFKPIQLGFGFTLNGVGGLIAINRGMNLDALAAGVRTNAIDAVMFPDDPIAEAPRIIADLNQFFPVAEGRYTFGLMAIIGWGTPTLIAVELGLIIQVPDPVQLAIIGVVRVQLPDKNAPIINLQANFIGGVDFEKGEMFFFAAIFESNLAQYRIEGEMYFALNWGNAPNFLFTVGGFHPAFKPPPLRAISGNLKRLTINLLPTDNPRLTIQAYFAVTSNTVQFGASVDFYFKVSKFKVVGYLYLDALFRFSPFYFIVEVGAGLSVMLGSSELLGIHLRGSLSGPTPWHLKGTASFKILFIKIKVRVNKRFGKRKKEILPPRPALPLLLEALRDTRNWEAALPPAKALQVTLRELPEEALIVHPAGQLTIRQDRLPLGMRFDKIGSERPNDYVAFRFAIEQYTGAAATKDFFAPAEFIRMSDSQRLSRKAFERMQSGKSVQGSTGLATTQQPDGGVQRSYRFEQLVIDGPDFFLRPADRAVASMEQTDYDVFVNGNAVSRSSMGRRQRFKQQEVRQAVQTRPVVYSIVDQNHLKTVTLNGQLLQYESEAEALQVLRTLQSLKPQLARRMRIAPATETATL